MNSRTHVIGGRPKVVLDQPSFLPAIHYQSPHILLKMLWFQLRPTLNFLKIEHFLSTQFNLTIDLVISIGTSQLMVEIRLLSFLLSRSHILRSSRSINACPFQIDSCDFLWKSGLHSFKLSTFIFSQNDFIWSL